MGLRDAATYSTSISSRPNNRLVELVKELGIKFRLAPDAERQLRQAGAHEKLIIATREVAP
jgi:hypothetical protein